MPILSDAVRLAGLALQLPRALRRNACRDFYQDLERRLRVAARAKRQLTEPEVKENAK